MSPKSPEPGWIEVICGPMFCGKTEELIRRLRRAQIAKMKTAIFKPLIDDRYSEEHIVSHNQMKMESYLIDDAAHILKKADGAEVVGIDEAQFLGDNLVDVCQELSANKKIVLQKVTFSDELSHINAKGFDERTNMFSNHNVIKVTEELYNEYK